MKILAIFKREGTWWFTAIVVIIGGLGCLAWYDETVRQPVRDAEWAAKTDMQKYRYHQVCLGGVAYWRGTSGSHGSVLAPKYTTGMKTPDTCP